jgi:disulfide bond formation protein DsbB
MPWYLDTVNKLLSIGTIFLQAVVVFLATNLIFFRKRSNLILSFFKKYTFYFGFASAFFAVSLSLFYSNIVGFPPCELCWIQRIFLYPQLILFTMELYKRDKSMVDFGIVFASFGSIVSMYHIYIENGGSSSLPCSATKVVGQVSCATRYIYEFGYVTIPIMSLTLSLFILIILLNYKYISKMQ